MFWGLVALLTLIAAASIALPLLRARAGGPGRAEFDRAVYRDQLAEIERDVERGVLSATEAKAARVEIERRLLATIEEKEGPAAGRVDPITVVSLTAAVAAGSVALYMAIGSPTVPAQPVAHRVPEQQAPGAPPPADLVASAERLERRLRENPNDVEGWMLLGRTQAILERFAAAAESYKRALQIAPMIPDANAGYGEMLVLSSNNVVTAPAVEAFRKALVGDPQNLAARFYLAAYDAQEGRPKEAVEGWRKLEADSPADAPWRPALRERIEATAKEAGLPVPPVAAGPPPAAPPQAPRPPRVAAAPSPHPPIGPPAAPPPGPRAAEAPRGPSAADVAVAQNMRPEDRQQMIRTMVDGLAARLQQNPDDVAGWQRLARAWRVLGEKQKAEEALGRVASLRPNDAEAQLEHARAMLDTQGGAPDPEKPLPPKFVAAVERVAQLDPKNQDALWYLGLAAAQRQDKAKATQLWNQLLAMLPPASDDHRTVKEALEALGAR